MTDRLAAELAKLTPEQRQLLLQRLRGRRQQPTEPPAQEAAGDGTFPLSLTQERFWLLETLSPGGSAYTVPFAVRLTGSLDETRLAQAVSGVTARHPALRAVVVPGQPEARQRIAPSAPWQPEVADLTGLPPTERDAELARLKAEHGRRTFALAHGPLHAVRLVKLSDVDSVLLVAVHHIVFDATSVGLFVRDLAALYGSQTLPAQPPPSPDRATHSAAELAHWIETLAGAPTVSTLPLDRPRPAPGGGQLAFAVSPAATAALSELIRRERVSLYAALLAGFALALRQANGGPCQVVGVPASTRTGGHEVIGCFYNPLPLRLDLEPQATLREVLHRAHRTVGQAQAHVAVPFGEIVRAVRPARAQRHNPLFQCMLSLVEAEAHDWHGGGVRFALDPAPPGSTDMDLFLAVTRASGGGLSGVCAYSGVFDEATVAAFLDSLTTLLEQAPTLIDRPIGGAAAASAVEDAQPVVPQRPPYRAPSTPEQQALAGIWAGLLRLDRVGIDDNFFELGGDSMQVIQAVAAAALAGLALRPEDVARHPTIRELAAVRPRPAPAGIAAAVRGPVPVTPAQAWFLHDIAPHMPRPHYFNHPYYLELAEPVEPSALQRAVQSVVDRHDSLRLRVRQEGGRWWQSAEAGGRVPFQTHDLHPVPEEKLEDAVQALASQAQARLSLQGGLLRAEHFRLGPGRPDRLLLICHHLCVDGLSRAFVIDELSRALRGAPPAPPATPFLAWAARMQEHSTDPALLSEIPFWREQARLESLPAGQGGEPVRFGARTGVRRTLTAEATAQLHAAARNAALGLSELLLAALARTIGAWQGSDACTVAVAAPGRQAAFDDIDVSRTVGWFQFFYPLRLPVPPGTEILAAARIVRDLTGRVPQRGLGHGLLTYSHQDDAARERMRAIAAPQVSFNYLGEIGSWGEGAAAAALRPATAPFGAAQDPAGIWPYQLDLSAERSGGRLRFALHYSPAVHDRASIERLADQIFEALTGEVS